MDFSLPPGKYVVAVSGGVDSVALLHMLQNQPGVKLTVAHFDHGIRADSRKDRQFVADLAKRYDLPFIYGAGSLGPGASEAEARQARYDFLRKVQSAADAQAIITAHHQDDLLETAVLNLVRGTGRKGLSSLASTDTKLRPLLDTSKQELKAYAQTNGLVWREDSTNAETVYLRNHIRHNLLGRVSSEDRQHFVTLLEQARHINRELDAVLHEYLTSQPDGRLNRRQFIMLPHKVAKEVMASWLRAHGIRSFDAKTLERLVWAAKVSLPNRRINVLAEYVMLVTKDELALSTLER